MKKTVLLTASMLAFAAEANATICYMEVDGQIQIQGPCTFEVIDDDGSFTIHGSDYVYGESGHFAYVFTGEEKVGHWSGEPGAGRAHSPLGELSRDGGCWVNQTVRVCAWK